MHTQIGYTEDAKASSTPTSASRFACSHQKFGHSRSHFEMAWRQDPAVADAQRASACRQSPRGAVPRKKAFSKCAKKLGNRSNRIAASRRRRETRWDRERWIAQPTRSQCPPGASAVESVGEVGRCRERMGLPPGSAENGGWADLEDGRKVVGVEIGGSWQVHAQYSDASSGRPWHLEQDTRNPAPALALLN